MSDDVDEKWVLMFWKSSSNDTSVALKEMLKELKGNNAAIKKFRVLSKLLENLGPQGLIEPHNKRLEQNLYELRDVGNGKRFYYRETSFFIDEEDGPRRVILLIAASGDKKSQVKDIQNAKERTKAGIELENIWNEEELEIKKME